MGGGEPLFKKGKSLPPLTASDTIRFLIAVPDTIPDLFAGYTIFQNMSRERGKRHIIRLFLIDLTKILISSIIAQ